MVELLQRMRREVMQWQVRAQGAQRQNMILLQRLLDKTVCTAFDAADAAYICAGLTLLLFVLLRDGAPAKAVGEADARL